MASIPRPAGLQDLTNVVFTRLQPYSDGDRFQYICRHASEVGLLEGLTVRETWDLLERNSRDNECRQRVKYEEWCDSVSQGMDPRFAFDFLFNLSSKRAWNHDTRLINRMTWKGVCARVSERYNLKNRIQNKDELRWHEEAAIATNPRLPLLRRDPRFIAIWRCFPEINFSSLDLALRYAADFEWGDDRMWFLYDQTVTEQRILERVTFNDGALKRMIIDMAMEARELEYEEIILNFLSTLDAAD